MNLHDITPEKLAQGRSGIVSNGLFWLKQETVCSRCDFLFESGPYGDYQLYDHHSCASRTLDGDGFDAWSCDHYCTENGSPFIAHYYRSTQGNDEDGNYFCPNCYEGLCPTYPS